MTATRPGADGASTRGVKGCRSAQAASQGHAFALAGRPIEPGPLGPVLGILADESESCGLDDGLDSVGDAELAKDRGDVMVDGLLGQE
jgi:hypothetical protein